jgi:hypothetical protein
MKKITKKALESMLHDIKFDCYYLEATFQFRLMIKLGEYLGDNDCIQPERNIERYVPKGIIKTKKEIDIVIEDKSGHPAVAFELKMPMKGQTPVQMSKFVEDIQFLEELKDKGKINRCFFIAVTNDKNFWEGEGKPRTGGTDIYKYFRSPKEDNLDPPGGSTPLPGKISKGKEKYYIRWEKTGKKGFRYCIVEI